MEFVAGPAVLVALAVALAADIAAGGQFGRHFGQALCGLPFQAGGSGAFLALSGTGTAAPGAVLAVLLLRAGVADGGGGAPSPGPDLAGFSRASISVASRATHPTMRWVRLRLTRASCI
jgi:hypothetical protein